MGYSVSVRHEEVVDGNTCEVGWEMSTKLTDDQIRDALRAHLGRYQVTTPPNQGRLVVLWLGRSSPGRARRVKARVRRAISAAEVAS